MSDLKKLVLKALVKEARDFYSLPNDVEADELLEKYSIAAIKTVAEWLDEHQFYPEKLIATNLREQLKEGSE